MYSQLDDKFTNKPGATGVGLPTATTHFSKYEDPTGEFKEKEFERAMWYVKHKFTLRKWLFGIIIGVNILLWVPSLIHWVTYAVVGLRSDENLALQLSQFPDYTVLHEHYGAAPLQIGSPLGLPGGVGKYDLISTVTNPNARFRVAFDYFFAVDGTSTPAQSAVFMAGESRPLVFFGYESFSPGVGDIIIQNVRWQRIDSHTIPDSITWQSERLNFSVSDLTFVPATYGQANAGVVQFSLTNNSAYGYTEPDFYVAFLQNNDLTGVSPLQISNFTAQSRRAVDIRTFADNISASEVVVYPLINLYNKSEYIVPAR
ncbi:MAG: hypothetical protein A3J93_01860 [Candidatus Magasanikbacteria bacterium RIFOXYC2_FULL_42_28]|uniref:Uncharacterized protein n=1 Tax=Candidatus Magasanikbacteria bacterium RIFOXYC2_FULL_42_28 TaxID=1798704 RepID=A0A1F6NY26_9BACT|nr:MAG: hypothetical protein A3J93_01860 [Candidatus Magasanikbacteria bacterium RIFOXYC2_FULL_42_28]